MKHIVRTLAITALCFGASLPLQSSEVREIRAVKDLTLHPLTPVTVYLQQGDTTKWVSFKRITDGLEQLTYKWPGEGVVIWAQMDKDVNRVETPSRHPSELLGQEIHIVKASRGTPDYAIRLEPARQKKSPAPKTYEIGVAIANPTDKNTYTLQITDAYGKPISKKILTQDPTTVLLRFNATPQLTRKLAKYNQNIINLTTKTPDGVTTKQTIGLVATQLIPEYQIIIDDQGQLTIYDTRSKQVKFIGIKK